MFGNRALSTYNKSRVDAAFISLGILVRSVVSRGSGLVPVRSFSARLRCAAKSRRYPF